MLDTARGGIQQCGWASRILKRLIVIHVTQGVSPSAYSNKVFSSRLIGASKTTSFYALSNTNPAEQCPPEAVTVHCQHQASPSRHEEDTDCFPELQAFKFSGLA